VDLSKAFDKVVREVAIGWPQYLEADKIDHLVKLGIPKEHAAMVAESIDSNGCVFTQLKVHPRVIELMSSLHTKSWFCVGEGDAGHMIVEKGGRQGCRFGGKIFNTCYGVALYEFRDLLRVHGVETRIRWDSNMSIWQAPGQSTSDSVPFVDVTLVDDEAIIITASVPATLN
jgi:hypothetical protein